MIVDYCLNDDRFKGMAFTWNLLISKNILLPKTEKGKERPFEVRKNISSFVFQMGTAKPGPLLLFVIVAV